MASIALPRIMRVGGGAVDEIGEVVAGLGLARPLVVTDKFLVGTGAVDRMVAQLEASTGGAKPAGEDDVLDRDGDAVQGAHRLALHHGDLGFAGRPAGDVVSDQTEGVQAGVERLDPGQNGFGDLHRRDLLGPHKRSELERREPGPESRAPSA